MNVTIEEDIANFHSLMTELRTSIDMEPVDWADKLLLTMASPSAGQWANPLSLDSLIEAVGGALDWINIMAYDYHGAWEHVVDANAPLPEVEVTVNSFLNNYKVPAYKLNLGLGFYGHSWNVNVSAGTKDVYIGYPTINGTPPVTYSQIQGLLKKPGSVALYNETEQVATMWTAPDAQGVSLWVGYDNPRSLLAKLAVVKKYHLGGAMLWSLDQDDTQNGLPLLTAVATDILGGAVQY